MANKKKRKLKIAYIITKLELGGAQLVALFCAEHINRQVFEPILITNDEGLLIEKAMSIPDLKNYFLASFIREIRPWKDLKALFQIYRILKNEKVDIVHTHSSKAGIIGRIAAWLAGIPVIIHTIHGFSFHDYQPKLVRFIYIVLERIGAFFSNQLVAVARDNIEKGLSAGVGKREIYRVIRAGIDIAEFAEVKVDKVKLKQSLNIESDAKIVSQIGNFKPQKNPVDFIHLAAKVLKEFPNAYFLMIGDGPLRPEIEATIEKYEISDRVKLLGWRNDVPQLMQITDVLALTSLWEGLPCVYPQAMAAGKPIVGTAVDGGPEAVHHGINGFMFSPGSLNEMAEKIIILLKDHELSNRLGKAGKELVAEFDIDKMVRDHEQMYTELATRFVTKIG